MRLRRIKKAVISVSCRNSETFPLFIYAMEPAYYGLRRFVLPDMDKWQMQHVSYIKALESEGGGIFYFEPPGPYE